MIVRARVILPISQPPIENGAVQISGNRIITVGRWQDLKFLSTEVRDLGDCILLPGLINAHCHLDYTDMAGMIPAPKSFSSWIKAMLALKAHWSYSEYSQSWINGAEMLLRSGTTTVVDIEAVPELLPDVWSATALRIVSLLELTNVKSRQAAAKILSEATRKIDSLPSGKCIAGLSPHALYSTSRELLKSSAEIARHRNWLLSTHVAESEEETEMFEKRRGSLFDWLESQREMSDCRGSSPVELLDQQGMLSPNFLAVHANYISESDAALLAKRKSSVVHCPQSHDYFGHKRFPNKMLRDAGVNTCLGTDSLASVTAKAKQPIALDMFSEMQRFARNNPDVPPLQILQMATQNGARALGMAGKIGELTAGSLADWIAVPFAQSSDPCECVVQNVSGICAAMIDGDGFLRSH